MDIIFDGILMKLNDEETEYIFNLKNKNDTANNYRKNFYQNNKERIKEYSRQYYLKNRDKKRGRCLIDTIKIKQKN